MGERVGEPKRRVDQVLENYLLALACMDQCDASAADELKARLTANAARAERAWADAAADGLVELPGVVAPDATALADLVARTRDGLHAGVPIAVLLATLEAGTDRATRLVEAALAR